MLEPILSKTPNN